MIDRRIEEHRAFSPRVWGWSGSAHGAGRRERVFPTRVGMVRRNTPMSDFSSSFPHACGDGPNLRRDVRRRAPFSPRVWGWSVDQPCINQFCTVFPTRVGMVRTIFNSLIYCMGFPHACGDGPLTQSWSGLRAQDLPVSHVFPTRVGMVRSRCFDTGAARCFPHACGDGPREARR